MPPQIAGDDGAVRHDGLAARGDIPHRVADELLGGYGIAFWNAYPSDATLADTIYFGLAAPVPILAALLAILAVAGFVRAQPGRLQVPGLVIALAWAVGLIVLFLIVEVVGNWDGDLVGLLRVLMPGGIILFLASLIVVIGTLTRFGRS